MKLHSPQFESGLKRLVKATIRSSPELKREHRRVKGYRRKLNLVWLWRLAISVLLGFAAWNIQTSTGHLATALAGVSVYLLAALCIRISSLWAKLHQSTDLPALTILPVATETIFQWELQKFIRESLFLILDLLLIFGALALASGFPAWKWACSLVFVAVSWVYVMTLSVYGALRLPRWIIQMASTGLIVIGVVLFFGRNAVCPYAIRLLDLWRLKLTLLLPTGWVVAPFELMGQSSHWWLFTLWLPGLFMLSYLKGWLFELRKGITYREFLLPQAADQIPDEDSELRSTSEESRRLGPSEIEEIVAGGKYLSRPGFLIRHFPEKILWRWLNLREQALAEFIHPNGIAIWPAWKKLFVVLAGMSLLTILGGAFSHTTQIACLGLCIFVVFCMALANLVNHGRTFIPTWLSGINVPMYAGYGIGYKELGGLFLKCALVQVPYLVIAMMILGGLTTWCMGLPIEQGFLYGIKVAGLIFALRFILVVFAFSSGTNDTSRFRLSSIFIVACAAVFGLGFLGLGIAGLFVPNTVLSFVFWGGSLLDAWILFLVYGWAYRFIRFDLMSVPRQ